MDVLSRSGNATGPRLTIQRLACRIDLPAGVEHPAAAADRLSHMAQRELPAACAAALDGLAEEGDAVYRIRRLRLGLWVDLQGMSESDVARRWGRLLAGSVARALRSGGPDTVLRFESPRHFVTSFLADLLDGRAWQRWYYDEFVSLQRLPTPQLAVQLLIARPAWIAPILHDLAASGHAERLISAWRRADVEALWTALDFDATPSLAASPAVLTAAWRDAALSGGSDGDARARDRLRLWLHLAAHDTARARIPALAATLHALVELAALLRAETELAPLLAMESEPYPALLQRIAAGPAAEALGWLPALAATEHGRQALAEATRLVERRAVAPQQPETPAAEARVPAAALASPVGSVFLLAPALAELALWPRWLEEEGEAAARRYLFAVALKALGRARAPLHLGDRMLAAFAGLAAPPVADLRLPVEPNRPAPSWAGSLPAVAACWYPAHARQPEAAIVQGVAVLRDAAAQHWLAAAPVEDDSAMAYPSDWPPMVQAPNDWEAEVRHLQLGRTLGYSWLTPTLDAALSVVASLALRRTAARLPRFHRVSPAYLASQFLAQPAALHAGPEAWTVQLSGGPLAVVLRLAALAENIDAPWLPAPLRLTLPTRM